jgi:ubiquinone/menaquinone biosynthesis C-methylase UbiE
MNLGWRYDLFAWCVDTLICRGKLRGLLRTAADLAQLRRGEAVLDVGCGTGTLAIEVQRRVGTAGRVCGIDPGPRQIARARAKAARRRAPIEFQVGVIERLPFPDQTFDVVLSTLMMHHLPDDLKRQGLAEIARVLKPGGRVVIVDFKRGVERRDHPARLGAGALGVQDQPALLQDAGFSQIDSGEIRLPRLPGLAGAGYARGRRGPAAAGSATG